MSRQMIKLDCAEDKTESGHSPLQAALGWRALIQPETGKVTKSQTRERARERPEDWRNLASCRNSPCVLKANGQDVRGPVVVVVRAEVREVAGSWPLRWNSAFIRLWDSRAWTVFGIALGVTVSVLIDQLISLKATERSQSLARGPIALLGAGQEQHGQVLPHLQCLLLSGQLPFGLHNCAPLWPLCPSGWWLLCGFHILCLSLYFGLSYPHLFPWLLTQLNYNFPMGPFHCAPSTQNSAVAQSNLCFLTEW